MPGDFRATRPDAGGGRRLGRSAGLAGPRALHGRGGGRGRALQDSRHPAHHRALPRRRAHRGQRHAERGRGAPEDPGAGAPPLGDGPHRGLGGGAASRSEAGDRRPCGRGLALRRARRRRCRFRPQAGRGSAPAGLARHPLRSRDPPSHLDASAGSECFGADAACRARHRRRTPEPGASRPRRCRAAGQRREGRFRRRQDRGQPGAQDPRRAPQPHRQPLHRGREFGRRRAAARRPLAPAAGGADRRIRGGNAQPLLGDLYYVERALGPMRSSAMAMPRSCCSARSPC